MNLFIIKFTKLKKTIVSKFINLVKVLIYKLFNLEISIYYKNQTQIKYEKIVSNKDSYKKELDLKAISKLQEYEDLRNIPESFFIKCKKFI